MASMGNNYIVTNWAKRIVTKSKQLHVYLKSDWTGIGLQPPDWLCGGGIYDQDCSKNCISKLSVGQNILYVFIPKTELTMPKDMYIGYHYFLGVYFLLVTVKCMYVCIFHSNILLCAFSYTF